MKTRIVVLVLCVLPMIVVGSFAQDKEGGPVGIFQSDAEYSQFMGNAKRAAYGANGNPELQAMIPMLNDIVLNKPMGWTANEYGVEASTLGLLADPNVRAELEMVDDQYEELKDVSQDIQRRAASKIRELDFKDSENLIAQIRKIRSQASDELNAVLLPHQLDRLRQIRMQSQLRRRSLVEVLTSDPVKSDLEITDQQSDELREAEKEIQADLAREIAKLQEKARDRLLSRLDVSQKAKAKEMIGDAFEFSQRETQKARSKTRRPKKERTAK